MVMQTGITMALEKVSIIAISGYPKTSAAPLENLSVPGP